MIDTIFRFLTEHISAYGAVFLVSMIPLIELRGSVIVGTAFGLPWLNVLALSIVGNLIPIPFILIFGEKLIAWLKTLPMLSRLTNWYEARLMSKSTTIQKYAFYGLWAFVGIPLPGTGAWSGSLIAALLDVPPKKAFAAVICGVLTAGIIMTIGSRGVVGLFQLFA
ncbi:COG2426 family protein [Butyricicoccus porcorum]|uniref:COG2426 family protein n=1 Tax=Butyricicoccus porcorum TaxID=1945634 RepID=UPI000B355F58|nr:small multi-drug export protein [Butyricicoccus porcorum]MCI6927145.1 small multi-drug export protein [Butyricicoccus porcorum]MDD6987286.1 small multi-drug export protein [Butyricicoccus porcorum]MDY4483920.1 small multi-drug export protein [Butyricicoccus porcorum]